MKNRVLLPEAVLSTGGDCLGKSPICVTESWVGFGFVIRSKKFSERRLLDGMDGKERKTPMFISLQLSDSRRISVAP